MLIEADLMKAPFYLVVGVQVVVAGGALEAVADPVAWDFEAVRAVARELAANPYVDPPKKVPRWLAHIGYDGYRSIEFDFEQALWRNEGLPFFIAFFHPGYIYPRQVRFHEVSAEGVREHSFDPDLFRYGEASAIRDRLPPDLGFPGFRVFRTVDEGDATPLISFLGASYFRARAPDTVFGLSGRAIAVDLGTDSPEEFPDFVAFWARKPTPQDSALTILALLDGPSISGAYEFVVEAGDSTRVDVRACIVLRREVQVLGLCAFSSMFWFGENTFPRPPDFRPEVHDSDGLAIETSEGEFIWRPLDNPPATRTDRLPEAELRRFGLHQRDRSFANYQDLDADYHRRPDAWVAPGPEIARGRLRLLEIETPHEFADNIALALEPSSMPGVAEEYCFSYTLAFGEAGAPPLGQVMASRWGDSLHDLEQAEFVIDFDGGELRRLRDDDGIRAEIQAEGSSVKWRLVRRNPHNESWRLVFRATRPASEEGARFKVRLRYRGRPLTETWQYWWQPSRFPDCQKTAEGASDESGE